MQNIYTELFASPVALSFTLLHLLVLAQCAIKFTDYVAMKRQLTSLAK